MDQPKAWTHDETAPLELTHEQYIEQLEEMGLNTEGVQDFEGRLTSESVQKLGDAFEEMLLGIDEASGSINGLVEMHQKLEPRHARSPKRHLLHKKAVENRKKRKRGGKK